jgi:predicted O-linked N-acetylglucosamine transferase (SPINDLY family)
MTIAQAYDLALQHYQAGRLQEAENVLRQILSHQPNHADSLHLVGLLAHRFGRTPKAASFIRRAIEINPNSSDYYNNLALIVAAQGEIDEAIGIARKAVELRHDFAQAHNNLGTLLSEKGQWDEAIESFRRALALRADYAEAQANLGNALKSIGQLDEALAAYRYAARLRSDPRIASNLLYLLHFLPDYDAHQIAQAHAEWNRTFASSFSAVARVHDNDRSPDRPLRIGYVSPDFRQHAVGRFLAPVLAHHDHEQFEIHCFSDVAWPDAMTQRLQGYADGWHDTPGLSDEQLAELVREHRIDILVDLTMHMEGSRLLAFARKPALVQVTYLAYCSTTGLTSMDYRLTDAYLDPPGTDEGVYSEKSFRLKSYWCYEAPAEAPPAGTSPFKKNGVITFGCLNNFSKVTQPALDAWRRLLNNVPDSRLILHCGEGSHRRRIIANFEAAGIPSDRIQFVQRLPVDAYFGQWNQIDIALDPFPYGGGTTTCDALWMGVPLVSLAGQTAVSRGGSSILSTIGLGELVSGDIDQYVEIASVLAMDPERLAEMRSGLRQRMQSSPLMDAPAFTRDVEHAFRTMWHTWCRR